MHLFDYKGGESKIRSCHITCRDTELKICSMKDISTKHTFISSHVGCMLNKGGYYYMLGTFGW